jgi:hypothetical protein
MAPLGSGGWHPGEPGGLGIRHPLGLESARFLARNGAPFSPSGFRIAPRLAEHAESP